MKTYIKFVQTLPSLVLATVDQFISLLTCCVVYEASCLRSECAKLPRTSNSESIQADDCEERSGIQPPANKASDVSNISQGK